MFVLLEDKPLSFIAIVERPSHKASILYVSSDTLWYISFPIDVRFKAVSTIHGNTSVSYFVDGHKRLWNLMLHIIRDRKNEIPLGRINDSLAIHNASLAK